MPTLFERIISREIPSDIVFENEELLAFRDVNPQAPVHVLLIPKKPIPSLNDLNEDDSALLGRLWLAVPQLAASLGLENGYRVVVNCGADGGQTVAHLHFHILGRRALAWPPG